MREIRRRSRWLLLILSAVCVAVIAAGIAIFLITSHDERPNRLGDQVDMPATYSFSSSSWTGEPDREVFVTIRVDGTATLSRAPIGVLSTDDEGRACVPEERRDFSGDGEWHLDSNGALQIDADEASLVLYPKRGVVGDTNWRQTRLFFCDGSFISFDATG